MFYASFDSQRLCSIRRVREPRAPQSQGDRRYAFRGCFWASNAAFSISDACIRTVHKSSKISLHTKEFHLEHLPSIHLNTRCSQHLLVVVWHVGLVWSVIMSPWTGKTKTCKQEVTSQSLLNAQSVEEKSTHAKDSSTVPTDKNFWHFWTCSSIICFKYKVSTQAKVSSTVCIPARDNCGNFWIYNSILYLEYKRLTCSYRS